MTTAYDEPAPATVPIDACILTTDRLVLRPLTLDEATAAHGPFHKAKSVVKYLRWEVRDHDGETDGRITKRLAGSTISRPGDGFVWAVEFKQADGSQGGEIGDVSLFAKSIRNAQFEIGWVFHPAIHGRGLATEATTAVIDLAFDQLGAHRVFAELDSRNEASARLCEILGMRQEALLKDREIVDGEWHDIAIYAVTASEWSERKARG
ncbi:GNAT family N-acetyltransferase [Gryllotalpicola ginsengisoli]|uniref:GNAT family N-acetyltransferase n=1 Tax=Gryllotalpicola ginsengisoli TaxID=444608 RepID=UPI0003B7A93F|nr:GNAT family protein [Gryllotalpicola ginsengisoli]